MRCSWKSTQYIMVVRVPKMGSILDCLSSHMSGFWMQRLRWCPTGHTAHHLFIVAAAGLVLSLVAILADVQRTETSTARVFEAD